MITAHAGGSEHGNIGPVSIQQRSGHRRAKMARDTGPRVTREIILPPTSGSGRVPFIHGLADSGATIGAPSWGEWTILNVKPLRNEFLFHFEQFTQVLLAAWDAAWASKSGV
jgi:hypothetical protein